ncbi:MAG: HtaA domain-containing protein [Leucobacter sp.]
MLETVWVAPNNADGNGDSGRTANLQADGTFTLTMEVPAFAEGLSYALYSSKAHGQGFTDPSQNTTTGVLYAPAPAGETTTALVSSAAVVEADSPVTLTASVAPAEAEGSVTFLNGGTQIGEVQTIVGGVASVDTGALAAGEHSFTAQFTPNDPTVHLGSTSAEVAVTATEASTPEVPAPSVEVVGSVTDLDSDAENVVTVKGSGFLPQAPETSGTRPPLAGKFAGTYVVFGSFADVWQPSEGALSSSRKVLQQKWAVPAENMTAIGGAASGAIELKADGTFETELTLTADESAALAGGSYGIATYSGSGAKYAPFETFTEVTFKKPAPSVEVVGSVSGLDPEAENVVTVNGSGFVSDAPATSGARPPLAGKFTGTYVVFGSFADAWQPSTGAASSTRAVMSQKWAVPAESMALIGGASAGAIELKADGTFETELTLTADESKALADGSYGIATYPGGGAKYAPFETFTEVTFESPEPEAPVEATGGLDWAFNTGWNFYVKNIAAGSIAGSNGATVDTAGKANYAQSAGGDFTPSTGVGTIQYQGTVRYQSTAHGIDIAIKNPWIVFTSKTAATLTAEVSTSDSAGVGSMKRVTVATLTPGASSEAEDGLFVWAEASGVFANTIQPAGWVDYAGDTIAPLSFTYGAAEPEAATGDLVWAFNTGWNFYIKNIAAGTIEGSSGATVDSTGKASYVQVSGGDYDSKTGVGSIQYQGTVRYQSTAHGIDIALKDPRIVFTSKSAASMSAEISTSDASGVSSMKRIKVATLSPDTAVQRENGLLSWNDVQGVFAGTIQPEGWVEYAGKAIAPLTMTYGAESTDVPVDPETPSKPPVKPTPKPTPKPAGVSQQAGSLNWGVSSGFRAYATGPIAKGTVSTSGVGSSGGAFLFPQATGGSWNKTSQTGSVQFSGVVGFSGHKGLMSETFANPVITVTSASSATMTVSGRTFTLNLAAGSKAVGANGEVSWSGVPVNGSISGGGGGGGGSFAIDPLSFTVGSASAIQYGSTTQTEQKADREAAATAPTTEGITIVTPAEELVPGGEIELTASDFEADERDILVVLYSDPIVLDEKAGANADGDVRWIGTLPEDIEPGTHTITLQGSTDAGAVITVVDPAKKTTVEKLSTTSSDTVTPKVASAIVDPENGPLWLWWVGAAALIALAGAMGGLVVSQRKAAAAAATSSTVL